MRGWVVGFTISKGSSFLGVSLIKARNLLKAWHRGDRPDLWRIVALKAVDLDPRTVMVLRDHRRILNGRLWILRIRRPLGDLLARTDPPEGVEPEEMRSMLGETGAVFGSAGGLMIAQGVRPS